MHGSLALFEGVLYVGSEARAAEVRAFDLDGRELAHVVTFEGEDGGAAAASGIAVDEDHRLWVADAIGERLLAFSLFGQRLADVDETALAARGRSGELGAPIAVISTGSDDEQRLWVASKGLRRYAVRALPLGSGKPTSLRPGGDPDELFHGVRGLAHAGDFLYVCESVAGRVQVFRDERFHFAFDAGSRVQRFFPVAAAALGDGRVLVVHGAEDGALLLFDAGGRLRRVLAEGGAEEGRLRAPNDVVVEPGRDDRHTRIAVIDRDGTRVQVFNLEGRCYGRFPDFGAE
ncbi:MAG: hypothetical protein KDC14_04115 [Planctomycetes bacterium]|nr:hypothetical protein [Planctomycetota bacterium]